jgi:hypothetical protein
MFHAVERDDRRAACQGCHERSSLIRYCAPQYAWRELPDFNIEVCRIVDVAIWLQSTRAASLSSTSHVFDTSYSTAFQQICRFSAEFSNFQSVT